MRLIPDGSVYQASFAPSENDPAFKQTLEALFSEKLSQTPECQDSSDPTLSMFLKMSRAMPEFIVVVNNSDSPLLYIYRRKMVTLMEKTALQFDANYILFQIVKGAHLKNFAVNATSKDISVLNRECIGDAVSMSEMWPTGLPFPAIAHHRYVQTDVTVGDRGNVFHKQSYHLLFSRKLVRDAPDCDVAMLSVLSASRVRRQNAEMHSTHAA